MPNINTISKIYLHHKWYWNPILWFLFGVTFTFISIFIADILIWGKFHPNESLKISDELPLTNNVSK
jgi:hypothetical protein